MNRIEFILRSDGKPKEKQTQLVDTVCQNEISPEEFMAFFESASDTDKGSCADAMKHISAKNPEILAPYLGDLLKYINYKAPRVKWGVPEAIGNMAKEYPDRVIEAIPYLLKNTTNDAKNTTVIKWCAAFALSEIAKYNERTREELLPVFERIISTEENNGVRNVYTKALKIIEKGK